MGEVLFLAVDFSKFPPKPAKLLSLSLPSPPGFPRRFPSRVFARPQLCPAAASESLMSGSSDASGTSTHRPGPGEFPAWLWHRKKWMLLDFLAESKRVWVSLLAAQGAITPAARPCICQRLSWGQLGCSQPSPGAHRERGLVWQRAQQTQAGGCWGWSRATARPPRSPQGAPAQDCRVVWAIASHKRCGKSCGPDRELPARAERVGPEEALTWGAGGGLGTAGSGS